MGKQLFSKEISPFSGDIYNTYLLQTLNSLGAYIGKRKLDVLSWDENNIAIPVNLTVDLPPLGNFEGLDIRKKEPVLIVFSLQGYPKTAPMVHTDRLDFPKNKLAHLYIAKEGRPPAFCYVKGSMNEWYATKTISDLMVRLQNWLRDAACGWLSENGEQFDPLRLEGYRGTVIYSYDKLAGIVQSNKGLYADSNFALGLFENTAKEEDFPSFRLEKIITAEELVDVLKKYIVSLKELLEKKTFRVKKYHLGYVLWSSSENIFTDYCVELPRTWENFKAFCAGYAIETGPVEEFIASFDMHFFPEIPVITGLKRPKPIIGFSANLEFVNFYVELKSEDVSEKKIITNIPVHFQAHSEVLTTQKAQLISGTKLDFGGAAIIGCGALGSKVALHFLRNGATNLLFLDSDKLSPHNLVRHALLPESEGKNKAVALMMTAMNMYRSEDIEDVNVGFQVSGDSFLNGLLSFYKKDTKWLFDFTASEAFFQSLLLPYEGMNHIQICRGNISNHGNLGILLFEGKDRNPRIDDLQYLLFAEYKENAMVKNWLQREAELAEKGISLMIGVGCNSETTTLADDTVSSHAAYFSRIIKKQVGSDHSAMGRIYLQHLNEEEGGVNTQHLIVEPLVITKAANNPLWEIRIKAGIIERMKAAMGIAMPHEIGGVFVGALNYKAKTIHVVDLIDAPPDSQSNPVCFFRGVEGLPEKVNDVNVYSGNQLGYIGEWHSHPFGPEGMSTVDAATVRNFKREFMGAENRLAVFLSILTPTQLLCYVY